MIENTSPKDHWVTLSFVLAFWVLVYGWGKHPDVPWGDGLGYALAIHNGYDLATNANSHFLYLNFHRFVMEIFSWENSMEVLAWASVFWSVVALGLVWQTARLWKGAHTGTFSVFLLASSFPFWRQASIVEVYAMETAFWAGLVLALFYWSQRKSQTGQSWFFLLHALGLLVHIHLVLVFPFLVWLFWKQRDFQYRNLLFYLIPVLVFGASVLVLRTNTFSQIFFDSIQNQMLEFNLTRKLLGPLYAGCMTLWFFPFGWMWALITWIRNRKAFRGMVSDPFFKGLLAMGLPVFLFAAQFPDPGIYVFLLPLFLFLALGIGSVGSKFSPRFMVLGVVGFQLGFFYIGKTMFDRMAPPTTIQAQTMKGGTGFLFIPWAKDNLASVLSETRKIPIDSFPEGVHWNVRQAKDWDRLHPGLPMDKR